MTRRDDFSDVVLGSLTSNAQSPRPPHPGFQGILLRAPRRVVLRPGAAIPVCGFYLLPAASLLPPEDPPSAILLAAVDVATGLVLSAHLTPPDPVEPPDEEDALSPAEIGDALRGGYFNPDLFDYLSLPWRPASYEVVAELAGRKSNVVRIRLEEERPD